MCRNLIPSCAPPPPHVWSPNRNHVALTAPEGEALFSELHDIAQFLAMANEGELSPVLARKIAIGLLETTAIFRSAATHSLFDFTVYGAAANACSSIGSPMELHLRRKQHLISTQVPEGLNSSQADKLKFVGFDALRQAAELHALFYGEEHELSIRLRQEVEATFRRSGQNRT